MNWIVSERQKAESRYNAGSKAREDVETVLCGEGFRPLAVCSGSARQNGMIRKLRNHIKAYREWSEGLKAAGNGDTVVIQYPVRNHTILMKKVMKELRNRQIRTVAVIHDLESLRLALVPDAGFLRKKRRVTEEIPALKQCSGIIVHNREMKGKMAALFGVSMERMTELEIFDYLTGPFEEKTSRRDMPVVIAGNLDKAKAGYVYHLPAEMDFTLYGANYSGTENKRIEYKGAVEPDELPAVLNGSFGLVWDGPEAATCAGVFGEYLKINNPHKLSLYLVSGIPVIVWRKSAMAAFVREQHCGVEVDSLEEISGKVAEVTETEYQAMLDSVRELGKKLSTGYYIKTAMNKVLQRR